MSATEIEDVELPSEEVPTATTAQWRLESLQVLNWGGFQGLHRLDFHWDATLLSGGSGTGKSTLLDAYTALMMPSTVAFNGASNSAGTGRARNADGSQRTLLTYLRGKTGVNDETGGSRSDNLLRGKGVPTWGAIAATFTDGANGRSSALRLFYVAASVVDVNNIGWRMATYQGAIDLSDVIDAMSQHTAGKPLAPVITTTWPGARVFSTYSEFSNTLFSKLAIGANGDGAKALDLLARIQAGRPVNSVNALYRDLVLDTPATFRYADLALGHFDTIAADLAKMIEAEKQHSMLSDIREVHDRLERAQARLEALDRYGLNAPGITKLTVWSWRKECEVLDAASALAKQRHSVAEIDARQAHLAATRLWDDLEQARTDYRERGGDELVTLDRQLEALTIELDAAKQRRADLGRWVDIVDGTLITRDDFDGIQSDARKFASTRQTWAQEHQRQRDALRDRLKPLTDRRRELQDDLDQLGKSGTRIKSRLGMPRDQIAARLGMTPAELPYLAELIDIRSGEDRWRNAIETVLGSDASRIVIPAHRKREIARAIDDLRAGRQVRFIDAIANRPLTYPLDGATTADQKDRILGKLEFADHEYAGWVQEHLAGPGLNALCTTSTDELDGAGLRVTQSGQIRNGIRSSIGRNGQDDIIGFSSASEVARIEQELAAAARELAEVTTGIAKLADESATHDARRDAFTAIAAARWEDIDTQGIKDQIAAKESRRQQIQNSDDQLRVLAEQIDQLNSEHQSALRQHARAYELAAAAEKTWTKLVDDKDAAVDQLSPYEHEEHLQLTNEQQEDLEGTYASVAALALEEDTIEEASRFVERLNATRQKLNGQVTVVQSEIDDASRSLTRTFSQYRSNWDDSNLGETLGSYKDYLAILVHLEAKGLYETREEWQRTVSEWSGQDLLPLYQSLSSEVEAIKHRVEPINDILATLPFGARRGRLKLKVEVVGSESVRQFTKQLRAITQVATKAMSFEEMRKVFDDIAAFMDVLRDPKDPNYVPDKSDRSKLLDVRRHVEVYAVEYPVNADTWPAREHRQLGSASGGESQELIAFIIGSALRFRLGDELRELPRFAPVFLDEGFVKADSEFAGRAVTAWRRLGFQIIVGTPEDKFTGLERHMESFLVVYKDQDTGFSYVDQVTDHRGARVPKSTAAL